MCHKTGNLHSIAVFDQRGPPAWYLGGRKVQVSIKAKLWVRDFMPKSGSKHEKTSLKPPQKKKRTVNPLTISSKNFSITPKR